MTEIIYRVKLEVLEYTDTEVTEPTLVHMDGVESGDLGWVIDEAKRRIIRYLEQHAGKEES